jgi:ABC-2 type transport system ATP-binding protein
MTAKQTYAIEAWRLQKTYKNVPVLSDVSFTVSKGEVFALLGANGAGKTTTINILTTLLKADGGKASVCGYDVANRDSDVRNHISLTGQFAAVDDILTARENLVMVAQLRQEKNPKAVANELLKQFDLVDAADRRVATFSGGMRRRLDIAMSLIGKPDVIFLDEPTTGLDPQSRTAMWQKIKTLAKAGVTVFLTTQYLEEADQLADKIAILRDGKIAAHGTPTELKNLLSGGKVELRFQTKKELNAAASVFPGSVTNDEEQQLIVTTEGKVSDIAQLFNRLQQAHLEPIEFTQKLPTLDDVFLKIINDEEKK